MYLPNLSPEELSLAFQALSESLPYDELPPSLQSLRLPEWRAVSHLLCLLMAEQELSSLH
jgi:hypothetical protein